VARRAGRGNAGQNANAKQRAGPGPRLECGLGTSLGSARGAERWGPGPYGHLRDQFLEGTIRIQMSGIFEGNESGVKALPQSIRAGMTATAGPTEFCWAWLKPSASGRIHNFRLSMLAQTAKPGGHPGRGVLRLGIVIPVAWHAPRWGHPLSRRSPFSRADPRPSPVAVCPAATNEPGVAAAIADWRFCRDPPAPPRPSTCASAERRRVLDAALVNAQRRSGPGASKPAISIPGGYPAEKSPAPANDWPRMRHGDYSWAELDSELLICIAPPRAGRGWRSGSSAR